MMEQDVAGWESRDADGDPYGAVLGGEMDLGWTGRGGTVQVQRCGRERNGRGLGSWVTTCQS
jgi:hypothetical protein